ncbi:unnamed protein product [Paramecium octaurelia]|uniref:Parkin co-regulated protein n=1 Tax=Paramecium octaurelia TaxID=43137 RepID=A0A8S1X0J3_PAROT|nr:unnamed protein product [Paramecium octaurelia]CAD8194017.1 unnamed protein product [Paramecium octaurelia]
MMYKQSPKINSNEQRMNQIHRNYVAADYNYNYSNNQLNLQLAEKMMIAYKHQKNEKKPLVTKKIKMVDPFSNKYQRDINSFAYVYEAGGIPCKINYNTQGNMKIQWIQDVNIQTIPYDPVLVTCFNGLLEDVHPYLAIATTAIQFMLQNEAAQEKIIQVLPKLVLPLRSALSSKSDKVFGSALQILKSLSNVVGSHLNKYLKLFLVPIWQRQNHSVVGEQIRLVLSVLEYNGGSEVFQIIKQKIPTYSNF